MNRLLLPADDLALLHGAVRHLGPGLICVEVCPLCARSAWRSTQSSEPDGIEAILGEAPCDDCKAFISDHPRIAQWMIGIIEGQKLLVRWTRERNP